jgi:predicted unusual protein kinase regulating ubiquinone biosynthesis (AarF/ABC1/UbiB family)
VAEEKPKPAKRKSKAASAAAIQSKRVTRAAKIGKAIGTGGAGLGATSVANVARKQDKADEAMRKRHVKSAETLVKTLGGMRGAATKIGQVASFVDVEILPEEYREIYQNELSQLRASAPSMNWKQVKRILEDGFDVPLRDVFSDFEQEAVAAASIGQVHRATLRDDGSQVAVKVQYPEIAEALRADLQNVGLVIKLIKAFAPGLDAKEVTQELKTRVLEELDYELEASNQRRFQRAYRDHPFIYIPKVHTEYSSERVMVSEWVEGDTFDDVLAESQAERDRFGEIVFRFAFGSIYHLRHLNADVHPGNYLRMSDGRVVFLDFGMTKRISEQQLKMQAAVVKAMRDDDPDELLDSFDRLGFVTDREKVSAQQIFDHVKEVGGWYLYGDRKQQINPKVVARVVGAISDPRSEFFKLMRKERMPADELLGRRMETGVLAVLGKLNATANWPAITREWVFAESSKTPMGQEEWDYFRERGTRQLALYEE